ncbi:MAG: DUF1549 and DUF1553 domain-containing protein, partial [Planctomycetales bacterium]
MIRLARNSFVLAVLVAATANSLAHGEQQLRDVIDARVQEAWKREGIQPAGLSADGTFLRRIYLDLCGTIPTLDEARAFLDDDASDKREKLIDRLLSDPRYAQHQADVWDMVLFGRNPPGYDARTRGGFQKWLRDQFAENTSYNKMVHQLLKAEGDTVTNGAPMYLVQYQRKPEDAAVAVAENFLGVQLQCARCHDHPFEDWTQLDFYGMAAFFARLESVTVGKEDKLNKVALGEKNLGDVLFTGPVTEDEVGKKGEPVKPKFLLGEKLPEPELPEDFKEDRFAANKQPPSPKFSRKNALADWVVRPDNPYLARAAANRVWAQFLGRGLVHPVDNLSPANEPSHPELLDSLAAELVKTGFDLKKYIRELCNSKTYQASHFGPSTEAAPLWYERARVRPLSAEELAETWRVATRYVAAQEKAGKKPKDGDRYFGMAAGYMLRFFGQPSNGVGDFQGGLHEHLYLNNGQVGGLISTSEGGLHHALLNSKEPWEVRV